MRWTELQELQARPLDQKIHEARKVIRQAVAQSERPVLAFSGGKDSTVLLKLVMEECPGIEVIYGDTGVEFPECRKFTKQLQANWNFRLHVARPGKTRRAGLKYAAQRMIWDALAERGEMGKVLKFDGKLKSTAALENACPDDLKPVAEIMRWKAGTRMGFFWCADQYGWPILGKAWSKLTARRINIDTFLRFSKSISKDPKLLRYYDVLRKVKISQHCCTLLKKEPSERVQAELGADLIFKGLMASESRTRAKNFLTRGWLFTGKKMTYLDGRRIQHCQPMATWTDEDVWAFIHRYNLPYASLYDMTYLAEDGKKRHIERNGCMFCATDFRFKNNHLYALRQTHPKAWKTVMRVGMGAEILKLQEAFRRDSDQRSLWGDMGVENLIESAPCVFDVAR